MGIAPPAQSDVWGLRPARTHRRQESLVRNMAPSPPPAPLYPVDHARKPSGQRIRDGDTYRSMVLRANISVEKQRGDAWNRLKRKVREAAQVLNLIIRALGVLYLVPLRRFRTLLLIGLG